MQMLDPRQTPAQAVRPIAATESIADGITRRGVFTRYDLAVPSASAAYEVAQEKHRRANKKFRKQAIVGTVALVTVGVAAAYAAPAAAGASTAGTAGTGSYGGMALAGGSGAVGSTAVPAGVGLGGNAATVTAAAAGTKTVSGFASLVKPLSGLVSAGATIAGLAGSGKSAGMTAEAALPAYAGQLQPTRPAGIVNGATAGKQAAWLAVAGLVIAAVFLKG